MHVVCACALCSVMMTTFCGRLVPKGLNNWHHLPVTWQNMWALVQGNPHTCTHTYTHTCTHTHVRTHVHTHIHTHTHMRTCTHITLLGCKRYIFLLKQFCICNTPRIIAIALNPLCFYCSMLLHSATYIGTNWTSFVSLYQ